MNLSTINVTPANIGITCWLPVLFAATSRWISSDYLRSTYRRRQRLIQTYQPQPQLQQLTTVTAVQLTFPRYNALLGSLHSSASKRSFQMKAINPAVDSSSDLLQCSDFNEVASVVF